MRGAATLFTLVFGSSACSVLLGLDDAEFDPSFEADGAGGVTGENGGAAGASDAVSDADAVAGSAGAAGASGS